MKRYKIILKTTKDYIEITEKKLFNLKKEKLQEYYRIIAVAKVLGGVAILENKKLDQIQDYLDSLISSRK